MITFAFLFLLLLCWRVISPSAELYDFNAQATLPLRGILAVFIMFHHISMNYDFTFGSSFLERHPYLSFNLFNDMGAPIVGVFFFLTGYGLAKSLSMKGTTYMKGFLKKRFSNILPEFIFLTILISLYYITYGLRSPEDIIDRYLSGFPPLPSSWFMYAIIYVYIAFNLSAVLARFKIIRTGIYFTILLTAYIMLVYNCNWGNWWYISIIAVPLGYFIETFEPYISHLILNRYFLMFLIFCVAATVFISICTSIALFSVILIYGIVFMTYTCMRSYHLPNWPILLWLGEISLNIYLIHSIFILVMQGFDVNRILALVLVVVLSAVTAYGLKQIRNLFKNQP